jgi:aspartate/methionine/tyrosine aminotransferase
MFADRTNWNLAPNRLSQALERHRASGKPLLDLTTSNPTQCGFEYDAEGILEALGNRDALRYEPDPKGLEIARRAVAEYYSTHGVRVATADLILTTSTSEAYSYIARLLCNPGDGILVPEPSYPLFSFLADIQDVKLTRYPLLYDDGWQIDFHSLERLLTPRTRAVIVVHPNNPTGHFVKAPELQRLNEIALAHDLALISDEVFLDFAFGTVKPLTFAGNSGALTFTLSGVSKICGLPQMKMAWLAASGPGAAKEEALARLTMIADTYLSPNAPVQLATPHFLRLQRGFQEQLMERTRRNLAELDKQLGTQKSCSRLVVEGGWYAVVRVPATLSDEDRALELLATRSVYVHPGHFYDFPVDGYIVVSLITRESEFAEGIAQLLTSF